MAKWIRFSNKDAIVKQDGLTTSGMEIKEVAALLSETFSHVRIQRMNRLSIRVLKTQKNKLRIAAVVF